MQRSMAESLVAIGVVVNPAIAFFFRGRFPEQHGAVIAVEQEPGIAVVDEDFDGVGDLVDFGLGGALGGGGDFNGHGY